MQPDEVRTTAQARAIVEERGLTHVKVGVFDNDGILRGKYIDRAKFLSALEKGIGFCDVVLGWDSNDQLYDNVTFTGWHTAYPDAPVRLLPETCREPAARGQHAVVPRRVRRPRRGGVPARRRCAACSSAPRRWATPPARRPSSSSSSSTRRPASVREKGYPQPQEPSLPATSAIRCCAARSTPSCTRSCCSSARTCACRSRACTPRPARACSRRPCTTTEALEAADRAALFKTFIKVLAQRRGLMATFMAKWSSELSGPERPPAHLARAQGRHVGLLRRGRRRTPCRRRCAGSSAASRR